MMLLKLCGISGMRGAFSGEVASTATCGVADVETFALGLQGDFDATDAALASPSSKGSSEEPTLISHT
jgi:hypothetical protein